ncbi:MAG: hypothetical protein ACOYEH_02420 [Caldicoprobacterales bacterium]|jgi:hypothetical protein|nr:hypothetical protein [Clostridiales bacterium]
MKAHLFCLVIPVIMLALLVSGCAEDSGPRQTQAPETARPEQPAVTPEPTPEQTTEPMQDADNGESRAPDSVPDTTSQLKALLPKREDYKWVYNGFAEYGHELELEEIEEDNGKIVYETEGEVFDMSAGESDRDFSLSVDFIVTSDSLIQKKKGEAMMDLFDRIILIQAPLREGHTWTQTVKENAGGKIELECTIEKVEDKNGARAYTILYQDKDSPYYEKRVITEGIGVTEFTRLYITEAEGEENFEISYWLYEEASGYDR